MLQLILPFITALLISALLTPAVCILASKFKWVVQPSAERWHKRNTPTLGGIAIFLSFVIPYAIFVGHGWTFWAFVICALGAFGLGLFDDLVHIKPNSKLLGQIIIASVFINFGLRINIQFLPYLSVPLTIIWIIGIMNAFNLLDNMDGLCAGIGLIVAIVMLVYSVLHSNWELSLATAILAGSVLGFLGYNFNPAKIFMGDCGSLFLGFVFAALAILGTKKEASSLVFVILIPSLILAVPIFDTLFVTLTRSMNSRPISVGGKDHVSHRLVTLGLSEKKAVLLLYFIAVICGGGALLYDITNKLLVLMLALVLVIGLLLFGMFLGGVEVYTSNQLNAKKAGKKKRMNGIPVILNGFIYNKRRILEVMIDFAIICISYVSAYLLAFEGVISAHNQELLLASLPIIIAIKLSMFFVFGLYRGLWKYIGIYDAAAIFIAILSGSISSVIAIAFLFGFHEYSASVFIIDWLVLLLLTSGARIILRLFREFFAMQASKSKRVLIIGAGDAGELLLREIRHNKSFDYIPVGFLDDDVKKVGNSIHGVPVLGTTHYLAAFCRRKKVDEVLIAIPSVSDIDLAHVFEKCHKYKINFRHSSSIMSIK